MVLFNMNIGSRKVWGTPNTKKRKRDENKTIHSIKTNIKSSNDHYFIKLKAMSRSVYFISDSHLGIIPQNSVPNREALFIETLLSWKEKASHIVIIGDLFEFWYEYRHYVNKHHLKLYHALMNLTESGVQVHYLRGNHDFALESFFPEELGVQVHQELVLDIDGERFFCTHGDGIPRSDRGYRFLRKVLDFPLNRFLFRLLHPDLGMEIALRVGSKSRQVSIDCPIVIEEYLEAAQKKMKKHQCKYFIHGHHHLKGIWNVPEGYVACCGQWLFS